MKAKRIFAGLVALAMTMGMMSSLVLADETENAPEETGVVETTEPKEKETKKPEEKKPEETKTAEPEEKEPSETSKEVEPSEPEETEPSETGKEEPSEPAQTTEPDEEDAPDATAAPAAGGNEDSHAVPPKNEKVTGVEIPSVSIKLDEPANGARPDYTATFPEGAQYYSADYDMVSFRNDIRWRDITGDFYVSPDNDDRFQLEHKYRVDVFLTAKEGYSFSENTKATLNEETANVSVTESGQLWVTYTFEPVLIKIANVVVEIDRPKSGAKPDYTASLPSNANYCSEETNDDFVRNGIYWYDETAHKSLDPDSAVFEEGHEYYVSVYLTPKKGYKFTYDTKATLNGTAVEPGFLFTSGHIKVSYTFKTVLAEISSVSVTLDAPAAGAKPDYNAVLPSGANYHVETQSALSYVRNGIMWSDASTSQNLDPDSSVFEAGHSYKVVFYLAADGENFLSSKTTAIINGQNATTSIFTGYFQVSYTFPALGENTGYIATVDGNNYMITNNKTDGTGAVTLTGVSVSSASVSIPATVMINGYVYKVNRIGAKAFYGDKIIKTVSIGSNVTIIDANAFYGCSNLTKVSGGKALKSIGANAFARCPKLSTFVITSTVLSKIGTYAFNKDSKLKTISIKNTTKLTKSGVKKSLKGSKVKTVKVKKSKIKKYKKIFKKKNSGRSVKVKK